MRLLPVPVIALILLSSPGSWSCALCVRPAVRPALGLVEHNAAPKAGGPPLWRSGSNGFLQGVPASCTRSIRCVQVGDRYVLVPPLRLSPASWPVPASGDNIRPLQASQAPRRAPEAIYFRLLLVIDPCIVPLAIPDRKNKRLN